MLLVLCLLGLTPMLLAQESYAQENFPSTTSEKPEFEPYQSLQFNISEPYFPSLFIISDRSHTSTHDIEGETTCIGNYSISYHYHATPIIGFGVYLIGTQYHSEHLNPFTFATTNTQTSTAFALMPELKLYYLNRPHIRPYSAGGLGLFTRHESFSNQETNTTYSKNLTTPMLHLTYFGIQVGNDRFYGLTEIGIGIRGIVSVGFGMTL